MTEQTEREALISLFREIYPRPTSLTEIEPHEKRAWKFLAMLDCGAYLDAAMMLVPEGSEFGMNWSRMSVDMGGKNWRCHVGAHRASGRTPALALCEAIRAAKDAANA